MRWMSAVRILGLIIGCMIGPIDSARADGNVGKGRELADEFCRGCHVVGTENRHGGIDSTPSFFLMHDKFENYRQRLWTLKKRPPHTAYERLKDVSNDDIEHLLAYIGQLQRPD